MSNDQQNNTSDESKLDGAGPTPPEKANAASPSPIRGGGKGKPPRKPPVNSSSPPPHRRGGYKTPPVDKQFKPGQSGNPNGRRKKPKLPRHVGNQINAVTAAIITELNHIMMHGPPTKPPRGPYAGAKLFARMFFRDATTKDGYARRSVFALYHEKRNDLDIFKAKDIRQREAENAFKIAAAIVNPTLTEREYDQVIQDIIDSRDEHDDTV
jgi:hypothetical protein